MRNAIRIGLTGVLLAGVAAAAGLGPAFHHTFELTRGDRLHLQFGDAEVELLPWHQPTLEVTVRYDVQTMGLGARTDTRFDVEFRRDGATIHIAGRDRSRQRGAGIGVFHRQVNEYVYTVRAPTWLRLELEGDEGGVELGEWSQALLLTRENGRVVLRAID
jgi:hypothetical protein